MNTGIEKRNEIISKMLRDQGKEITDNVQVMFSPAVPQLESEIVENLGKLREMGAISQLSMIEKNPYVNNVLLEVKRIGEEGVKPDEKQDCER